MSDLADNEDEPTRLSLDSQQSLQNAASDELEIGDLVDDYEILSLLGTGGMGYVYEARHRVLNKVYALKTIKADRLNETIWRRLQVEAQAIARMNHPNIVGIHNFGMHDGRPFYVMDLLTGNSLAERLKKGPLPAEQAIDIFIEVCCGLNYAHKKGIIHRDIKPGNIIILAKADASGAKVKIVDFGIAKLAGTSDPSNQHLTSMGEIFGSPLYMSPEQCLAERTDARSDVYSVGCTLFETLTGQPPFRGNNQVQTMMLHQSAPAPTLAEKAPRLHFPDALEAIIAKMLAKKPMERYQNLAAAADDLEQVSTALSTSEGTQKASEIKRNLALAVVAIAACTLIVASLAFLAISGTASIPALTKLFVGQKDFSTSKVESKINENTANSDKFLKEDQNRLTGPICRYERKNKKLVKVFDFPQMVFGIIYSESSGRSPQRASGRLEYAADDQLIFAAKNKMMTHPENFKAIKDGDFYGIHLLYLAEGKPAKEDSMVPAPEAEMSDISACLRNMAHLNKLENLSLAHCTQLKDSDIELLDQFPHLNALDLTNTNAKGSEVAKLKCLKNMRNLDFTVCRQITPVLRSLAGSKNILWLKASELSDGPLSKEDLSNIATLSNLEKLELNGVGINNEAIEILSRLPKLRELTAQMGTVDRRALKTLQKMKTLETADLKNPLWLGQYERDKQKPRPR